ncbi:uncharacterized protein LOC135836050 isoform X2 [Planococcus citri]|uniref:uncharacterized protein LOC135836050 isoform X2 n=1 Tax=Planococcus citri TaxID=170843 RepID=UPI0031F962D2
MNQDQESKDSKTPSTNVAAYSTPSLSHSSATPSTAGQKKTDKTKNLFAEFQDRATFNEAVERDREDYEEVLHQKRMTSILNEVKFLEETDWMYPCVESILGFKDERPIMLASCYESAANLAEAHMFRAARGADRTAQ